MEERPKSSEEKEINILDLFLVLLKRKRMILGGTAGIGLLTLIVALLMTPIYVATTQLMPPDQNGGSAAAQLLSQFGGAAGLLLGTNVPSTSSDLYIGLFQTPAIMDPIIERFDLLKRYDVTTKQDARKILINDVLATQSDTKSQIVSVSISDPDPQVAADMANAFVEELKKLLESLAITEAGKKRVFFEHEMKKTLEELNKREDAIRIFQEKTGAIKIEDQAVAIFQGIAMVKNLIAAKEVKIKVMMTYATANNPDLKREEEELSALKSN
jgi:uncharacterized protein involved in exopolysaccharide biosynthesis